jgi:S1-C subfamily serine protease
MRNWMADLTGLVIGFAIGGAALLHLWPQIEGMRQPEVSSATVQAPPALAAPMRRLPAIVTPAPPEMAEPETTMLAPPPAVLPEVISPDEPDPTEPPHQHGHGAAGTGFFVADGQVLTAAHVVDGCRRAEIVSPFVRRTQVRIAARDARHDIALLEAHAVRAPAALAIGRPTRNATRVFVLGYPASAGLLVPQETWGVLENSKLPRQPASLTDPRQQIWMEAGAVTHGYSGGPIFDPRSGKVVGIVRATLDGRGLRAIRGMPTSGIAVGPGSALLDAFLQDEAPGTDAFPADQWGDDPLTVVRHATVHVFCWY